MELHVLMPHPTSLGMGYVFTAEDGRLLVIDGGLDDMGSHRKEGFLFSELQRISGKACPEIAGWIFTHAHSDHFSEFCRMCEEHPGEFSVRRFFFHFMTDGFAEKVMSSKDISRFRWFHSCFDRFYSDRMAYERYPKVKVGDVFELPGIRVEFLRVPNENILANAINNTSIVFRLTAQGQTYLFLGDLGIEGGNELVARYGDALACDVCQMAHHGQKGCDGNVYAAASPKICLFPAAIWNLENWGPGDRPGEGNSMIGQTLAFPGVAGAEHLFACKTGTTCYPLPLEVRP